MYTSLTEIVQTLNFTKGDAYTGITSLKGFSSGDCGGTEGPGDDSIIIRENIEKN